MPERPEQPQDVESGTGLPGFRSWRAVYLAVAITFVVWLGILTWLTGHYT